MLKLLTVPHPDPAELFRLKRPFSRVEMGKRIGSRPFSFTDPIRRRRERDFSHAPRTSTMCFIHSVINRRRVRARGLHENSQRVEAGSPDPAR